MLMTDKRAADVICKAYPRWWERLFLRKYRCWMSVHTVCDALIHARMKCGNEDINACIKWAYSIDK